MGGNRHRRGAALAAGLVALGVLIGPAAAGSPDVPGTRALFFGDSLMVGTGAKPAHPVQARTAAERLGWQPVVDGWGGTGYTTGGRTGRAYLDRLRTDGYLRTRYDVIVLEGGTNDAHHGSLTRLSEAAARTVDYVRVRQPQARLVLVGAFAPAGVELSRYAAVDRILARVAAERDLQYISQLPYSAVTDPGFLSRDGLHPSDAGYARMGRDLATALAPQTPSDP